MRTQEKLASVLLCTAPPGAVIGGRSPNSSRPQGRRFVTPDIALGISTRRGWEGPATGCHAPGTLCESVCSLPTDRPSHAATTPTSLFLHSHRRRLGPALPRRQSRLGARHRRRRRQDQVQMGGRPVVRPVPGLDRSEWKRRKWMERRGWMDGWGASVLASHPRPLTPSLSFPGKCMPNEEAYEDTPGAVIKEVRREEEKRPPPSFCASVLIFPHTLSLSSLIRPRTRRPRSSTPSSRRSRGPTFSSTRTRARRAPSWRSWSPERRHEGRERRKTRSHEVWGVAQNSATEENPGGRVRPSRFVK